MWILMSTILEVPAPCSGKKRAPRCAIRGAPRMEGRGSGFRPSEEEVRGWLETPTKRCHRTPVDHK